jgi:hypothetical protein
VECAIKVELEAGVIVNALIKIAIRDSVIAQNMLSEFKNYVYCSDTEAPPFEIFYN